MTKFILTLIYKVMKRLTFVLSILTEGGDKRFIRNSNFVSHNAIPPFYFALYFKFEYLSKNKVVGRNVV